MLWLALVIGLSVNYRQVTNLSGKQHKLKKVSGRHVVTAADCLSGGIHRDLQWSDFTSSAQPYLCQSCQLYTYCWDHSDIRWHAWSPLLKYGLIPLTKPTRQRKVHRFFPLRKGLLCLFSQCPCRPHCLNSKCRMLQPPLIHDEEASWKKENTTTSEA